MMNDFGQLNLDWTVRVTFQQRIYPRHLGKLVSRSIRKRLGLFYS